VQKRAEDTTVAGRDSYNEWLLIAETDWESKAPRSNQRFGKIALSIDAPMSCASGNSLSPL
jgi:hypothetical protein